MTPSPIPPETGDLERLLRGLVTRSVRLRGAAPLLAVLILGLGLWSLPQLPLDVTPDISNVQVQVLTSVPDLSPEETETSVTRPLEQELAGLPHLEQLRSLTRFGVSQVCLIFADGTDLYQARQMVSERLSQAQDKLPTGLVPRLAPPSSGLGEVFTYAVKYSDGGRPPGCSDEAALRQLKLAQEFIVKPCLKTVPGVAEINTTGGEDQEMVVAVNPTVMNQYGVDLTDIANIIQRNASVGGGALVERDGTQFLIRSRSRTQFTNDFSNLCIRLSFGSETIPLSSVATVTIASGIRLGAATWNGQETVLGTALMLNGGNARAVARAVGDALNRAQERLPAGMEVRALYNRADLVDHVMATVRQNLLFAALLVLAVLLLFLHDWRAALIAASVLVLAFCLGLAGMVAFGIMGSLMTLGAIDFGVVVDDAIVMVENVSRQLVGVAPGAARRAAIVEACCQVRQPMLVGMLIIIGAYVPVLTLGGVEGRMFRPLAEAVILLLSASLLVTLTLVPAFCALGLTRARAVAEPRLLVGLRTVYTAAFSFCHRFRPLTLGVALLILGGAIVVARNLGADFLPALDEEWLVVEVQRDPSVSLARSVELEARAEQAIRAAVPEVRDCFSRLGMSAIATDPQGANQNDIYLSFQPREQWRQVNGHRLTKAELAAQIQAAIEKAVPGQDLELNQPIAVRFDELLEGVRTAVALKVFGPDCDVLDRLAHQMATVVKTVPGAGEVVVDEPGRTEMREFHPNRAAMLRYMATSEQINNAVAFGLAGRVVGRIDDGNQFYSLAVRVADSYRTNLDALNSLPVRAADGSLILGLGNLGGWESKSVVTAITREDAERREAVLVGTDGTDAVRLVERIRAAVSAQVLLPPGYRVEYGGAWRNWESGSQRLLLAGLLFLLASLALVQATLRNPRQTLLVALGIPFALAGGIYGLGLAGLPLTLPAVVGLVTLGGLSLLNGLVLITRFNQLLTEGRTPIAAAREAAVQRLRPVLMTALVAGAGFIPMALSHGVGAEVQRPFALVVLTGILTSTSLTLLVVPLSLPGTAGRRECHPTET